MCHGWKAKDEIKAKRFVCAAWKFPGGVEVFALRKLQSRPNLNPARNRNRWFLIKIMITNPD